MLLALTTTITTTNCENESPRVARADVSDVRQGGGRRLRTSSCIPLAGGRSLARFICIENYELRPFYLHTGFLAGSLVDGRRDEHITIILLSLPPDLNLHSQKPQNENARVDSLPRRYRQTIKRSLLCILLSSENKITN